MKLSFVAVFCLFLFWPTASGQQVTSGDAVGAPAADLPDAGVLTNSSVLSNMTITLQFSLQAPSPENATVTFVPNDPPATVNLVNLDPPAAKAGALPALGNAHDFSGDGNTLAVATNPIGGAPGIVQIYRKKKGVWVPENGNFEVKEANAGLDVSLCHDGKLLAIGAVGNKAGNDKNVRGTLGVFKFKNGLWQWVLYGRTSEVNGPGVVVSVEPDGSEVVFALLGPLVFFTVPIPKEAHCKGDPHFRTWKNEHYEFHGQCDLVMASDPKFAEGLGLDIHLRTQLVRYWSYIKIAAVRIGNDILEVKGSAEGELIYWINYEFQGELDKGGLAGFPVTIKERAVRNRKFVIDLSKVYPGQSIEIQAFKEFVGVSIINASEEAFGNTVGMSGDYKTGNTYARDGATVLHDFTELGNEWQVIPSDPKLFHELSHPQFPEMCVMPEDPRGQRRRRLEQSSITVEEAEAACAGLEDEATQKDCVYDVLATQDIEMVGAF